MAAGSTSTCSANRGPTTRWCGTTLVTPESWADVEVSPSGAHALVHVSVGWKRTDVHLYDCATSEWRVVVEGVDERTAFGFDGDRLLGFTTRRRRLEGGW